MLVGEKRVSSRRRAAVRSMTTPVRGMELLLAGGVHMAIVGAQMLECNSPWQWMCNNGECIAQYDLCNGIAQCSDASDEVDCALRNSQQNFMGVPREEQMKPSTSKPTGGYSSTDGSTPFKMPMMDARWFAIIGIAFLVFIAFAYIHYRRKRASMRNRAHGLRGDNNSDNDEDDLLISALYS